MDELRRFVDAQAPVFEQVQAELRAGHKRTHWMWFVFPQLKALGRSSTAKFYGLDDAADARSYLAHELLGPRLKHCVELVLGVDGKTAHEIFGSPDDLKFFSCMTLFELVSPDPCFGTALDRFYGGMRDEQTLGLANASPPTPSPE